MAQIPGDDDPCELGAFVAERHGLPLAEAEHLIESWLAHYESPTSKRAGEARFVQD